MGDPLGLHIGDGRRSGVVTASCDPVVAGRLGEACRDAATERAGDLIDRGLLLLRHLAQRGFRVVVPGADSQQNDAEIARLRAERDDLVRALRSAVAQADGWHDDEYGGPVADDTEECGMEFGEVRAILAKHEGGK